VALKHSIGPVTAKPNVIPVKTTAPVIVTAQINDPDLIQGSVTLLRLGPTAHSTILGQLNDNGNGNYTIQVTFNEPATGQILLQVSAMFTGLQQKVYSNVLIVKVWNGFSNTQLQFTLDIPPLGQPTQAVVSHPQHDITSIDFELWDPAQQAFFSQFGVNLYSNPTHESLQDWFAQNVDVNGVLTANGTFQEQQLGNGLTALVLSGPIPEQYTGGPVEEAYVLSPSSYRVLSIAQSQDETLFNQGYSQDALSRLLLQILGSASF
jgi:hypothetical protein